MVQADDELPPVMRPYDPMGHMTGMVWDSAQ